jgi:nucleotide-binding universal stress UspA family protein
MTDLAKESGVKVGHKLLVGIPEDSILQMAEDTQANLIAMGTQGRTGWDRLQFGSVVAAILRKAPCPVLTVYAEIVADFHTSPRRVKVGRLLIAMDFSPSFEAALRSAVILAKRFKAEAVLVHASEPVDSSRPAHGHDKECSSQRADHQFQQTVSALQADQFVTNRIFVPGNPVEVILDQAKCLRADLIVMGIHRRRGLRRLVLGSVAESVVRRACCPVLVVRAAKRRQNL